MRWPAANAANVLLWKGASPLPGRTREGAVRTAGARPGSVRGRPGGACGHVVLEIVELEHQASGQSCRHRSHMCKSSVTCASLVPAPCKQSPFSPRGLFRWVSGANLFMTTGLHRRVVPCTSAPQHPRRQQRGPEQERGGGGGCCPGLGQFWISRSILHMLVYTSGGYYTQMCVSGGGVTAQK